MKFKKVHILGLIIVGGLIFTSLDIFDNSQNKLTNLDINENKFEIKINEKGQTYGSNLANTEYGNEPDLILVEADNGKSGYVYKDDFYDTANQPKNPEEAVAYTKMVEKKVKKHGYYKAIPVYEKDGTTVIGSFKIGSK